jgi:hypothetical protein
MNSHAYRSIGIIIIILLVAILTSGFGFPGRSETINNVSLITDQPGNQNCANLDVVFLVDQSFGMSAPGTVEASDPLDQRKFAVGSMIDLLTGLSLDQCPGTHHRIGVISYGNFARVDLPLTDIAPTTPQQANDLRSDSGIKKNLVADNLGKNNPMLAFNAAWTMLRTAPDIASTGGSVRKKVVIFLTNAVPNCDTCSKDTVQAATEIESSVDSHFPFDSTLLGLETCLANLRLASQGEDIPPEKTNECLAGHAVQQDAYNNSIYIWTVFLRPPGYIQYADAYQHVVEHYKQMSESHGGDAIQLDANSLNQVPVTFRTILSSLAGVRPVLLKCGEFAVNPYLREARITVYKISPDLKVTLSYRDDQGNDQKVMSGQPSSPNAFNIENYYSFGANEAYLLEFPHPGIWQLTADNCAGLDTYYEQVDISSSRQVNIPDKVAEYNVAPFYDPDDPQYLSYQMRDSQTGTVVPQAALSQLAIDANAVVSGPDGQIEYPMAWDESTNTFRTKSPLQVKDPGVYTVRLVGNTHTHVGSPSPLSSVDPEQVFSSPLTLFDLTTQFTVYPVTPYSIKIISPKPNEVVYNVHQDLSGGWPLRPAPLQIQVQLSDQNGSAITSPKDYLSTTQNVLTAQVSSGTSKPQTVNLQLDPNIPGVFQGEIDNFDASGTYHIIVQMDRSAFLADKRPYQSKVEEDFKRIDTVFHNPVFYPFLFVLMCLGVFSVVFYNVATTNNKITGTLAFQDGKTTIAEFNLKSGRNWKTIGPRELKQYPQLMLKSIKAVNINQQRGKNRLGTGDFMEDSSFGSTAQKQIRVQCVSFANRHFVVDLDSGLPVNYDDATMAQMLYQPIE